MCMSRQLTHWNPDRGHFGAGGCFEPSQERMDICPRDKPLWLSRSYWAGRFFGWIKVTLKEHCLSSKFRAGPEAAAWSAARRDTTLQVVHPETDFVLSVFKRRVLELEYVSPWTTVCSRTFERDHCEVLCGCSCGCVAKKGPRDDVWSWAPATILCHEFGDWPKTDDYERVDHVLGTVDQGCCAFRLQSALASGGLDPHRVYNQRPCGCPRDPTLHQVHFWELLAQRVVLRNTQSVPEIRPPTQTKAFAS
ncbi:unnamed protein product [Durusdinium trenchii]|uniref:Uncharacterized protein n=1 Tax=Durusdinium trenchii TaxID=1381693 RepID=A0ABP0HT50_9DINO